jgi:AraC-like DNA-binding protein
MGDPCLGLHFAEAVAHRNRGVIGYLLQNCRTVREGVSCIARYVSLHLDGVDLSFVEADGVGQLQWRFPPSYHVPRLQYVSFAMALIIIRLRRSAGANWMPMRIELEHRELGCKEEVLRILGPNVHYDCPANTLCIRESVLNRGNPDVDETLFNLIHQLGDRLLAERKVRNDQVSMTQRAIVQLLDSGDVTLEQVAEFMGLSPWTLRSRLTGEGTTFEALLQETRQSLTDIYLRDTDLPLTEIALLLGFSELSAFTRAASRWFGVPPRVRRMELRNTVQAPA